MNKDIKNIIFDMGGVLVGFDIKRCIDAFSEIGCQKVASYVEEHRTEDLFLDTELGHITESEFCREVRRRTGSVASDEQIVWAWNELLTGIPHEKLDFLLALKKRGYRLFLLSNTNSMHWHRCRDAFFSQCSRHATDYFEHIFLSYEMHLAKPDPEIFRKALSCARLTPSETLFIDDTLDNCRSAASVGMATLHETTGNDFMTALI